SAYLWTLPMFHCDGWCFPWAVTGVGARHVCLPSVDPQRVFQLVDSEQVTHFCGAPTVLISLATNRPSAEYRFPRAVRIVTAAAPPPPAVIQQIEDMGADIYACLRSHRGVRAAHHLPVETGMGRSGRSGTRAVKSAPGRWLLARARAARGGR